MKRLLRAATVTGITTGVIAFGAPFASADVVFINEFGPGNASNGSIRDSKDVKQTVGDESVTSDIDAFLKHVYKSSLVFEVEGAEQDQNEKDGKKK